jgi:hypothetical protein
VVVAPDGCCGGTRKGAVVALFLPLFPLFVLFFLLRLCCVLLNVVFTVCSLFFYLFFSHPVGSSHLCTCMFFLLCNFVTHVQESNVMYHVKTSIVLYCDITCQKFLYLCNAPVMTCCFRSFQIRSIVVACDVWFLNFLICLKFCIFYPSTCR